MDMIDPNRKRITAVIASAAKQPVAPQAEKWIASSLCASQ
jgi:hypothetical protein